VLFKTQEGGESLEYDLCACVRVQQYYIICNLNSVSTSKTQECEEKGCEAVFEFEFFYCHQNADDDFGPLPY
jgi:hypothetical protein